MAGSDRTEGGNRRLTSGRSAHPGVRAPMMARVAGIVVAAALLVWSAGLGSVEAATLPSGTFVGQSFVTLGSSTPAIEKQVAWTQTHLGVTARQQQRLGALTRIAEQAMLRRDPAGVGAPGPSRPSWGRTLDAGLRTQFAKAVGTWRARRVIAAVPVLYRIVTNPAWRAAHIPPQVTPHHTTLEVYATGFSQPTLPGGLMTDASPYVALPDAYLKFATWDSYAPGTYAIPQAYWPYYGNGTSTLHRFTVTVSANGRSVADVPVTDVGPWNEDDNYWDPTDTVDHNTPTACAAAAGTGSTSPLVNGVCAVGANWRRTYYYLLYRHSTTLFDPAALESSGTFSVQSPPTALPLAQVNGSGLEPVAESFAASLYVDPLVTPNPGPRYNGGGGTWLYGNAVNPNITNQAGIDLSPAVEVALGWISTAKARLVSGFVTINVSGLP